MAGDGCKMEESLVEEAEACPRCGERRMDWLVWQDDGERVQCGTCGYTYEPGA